MKVLAVASECAPLVKTGGLADVVGALPKALAPHDVEIRTLLPAYAALVGVKAGKRTALGTLFGGEAAVVEATADDLDLLLLDAPHLFDRPGNPYLDETGADWPDNHLRFGGLCQAAAALAREGLDGWRPDVVHAHDWQAGLVPAYLRLGEGATPPTVVTIHNIAFQGLFSPVTIGDLGLPSSAFTAADGFEYYNQISFLKAGLVFADRLTTVSPSYARELMTPEFGMGLHGVLASRAGDLVGILNGVDTAVWDPQTDGDLAATYSGRARKGKAVNKAELERRFDLPMRPDGPLFCVVSRLTRQKGIDVLLEAIPRLVARGARLAVLGSGDADLEAGIRYATTTYPEQVSAVIGYDEPLSHLMQGGADAILIPSRFEPCGLTQLYGLRYGTIPVVARTGGLADTVIDANDAAMIAGCATGFQFAPVTPEALGDAIERVCDLHADQTAWRAMVGRAMRHPVGWDHAAHAYATLYRSLTATTTP